MGKELNATCHLCGKKYHRCDDCDKLNHVFVSWKNLADSEDHFKVFNIVVAYSQNKIKKEDAVEQLKSFDLSDIDTWEDEEMKAYVKGMLVEEKKTTVKRTDVSKKVDR